MGGGNGKLCQGFQSSFGNERISAMMIVTARRKDIPKGLFACGKSCVGAIRFGIGAGKCKWRQ